jgi:HPt (histidine-containing phosphotransfer) domain-containing protein
LLAGPHSAAENPVIVLDRGAIGRLVELIGDDPADLVEMMESFLTDAEALVTKMTSGADLTVIARTAHTLKSNARDFGASDLAVCCEKLERDLKSGQAPADLDEQLAAIRSIWPRVKVAIEKEIAAAGVQ